MKHTLRTLGACLLGAGLLAACGGGDDDGPVTAAPLIEVPVTAAASSTAYTQFVATQVLASSETAEPLSVSAFAMAPTSETDEPLPVN